jgi:hypothetical protein
VVVDRTPSVPSRTTDSPLHGLSVEKAIGDEDDSCTTAARRLGRLGAVMPFRISPSQPASECAKTMANAIDRCRILPPLLGVV